jgi:hypothetical protein
MQTNQSDERGMISPPYAGSFLSTSMKDARLNLYETKPGANRR